MRGGAKSARWKIAVSGCFNFHSSSTNSISYESWHLQLKFETSLRSLRVIVWPQEVSEVTEVKMIKILGENPKITNFCLTEVLYTSKEASKKSSFIFEIKLEDFVIKKLKKNRFCDFRSQKILIFYRSWLNSEKPVQIVKKWLYYLLVWCLWIKSRIFVTIAWHWEKWQTISWPAGTFGPPPHRLGLIF